MAFKKTYCSVKSENYIFTSFGWFWGKANVFRTSTVIKWAAFLLHSTPWLSLKQPRISRWNRSSSKPEWTWEISKENKTQLLKYNQQQNKLSAAINDRILTPAVSMCRRTWSCSLRGFSVSDKLLIRVSMSAHGSISLILTCFALGDVCRNFSYKRSM